MTVELGDPLADHRIDADQRSQRFGGLASPRQRAGVERIDGLGRQPVRQQLGLAMTERRQRGICRTTDHLDPLR